MGGRSADTSSAYNIVAVASGVAFPTCRGLLVGTAGTATVITAAGATATNIPLQEGYNPIQVSTVTFGTASDVWALY